MSVQYNKIHPADVPVVDLDDPEDDVLFNEQRDNFINSLDYEQPSNSGFMGKIRSYFNTRGSLSSYELAGESEGSDFFNVSDDDSEERGPRDNLRDYHIKRLNQKLNRTIWLFAAGIMFVVIVLFFNRKASKVTIESTGKLTYSNSTHEFHKTTIMVSLDGFHPHYISSKVTPTMHKMLLEDYGAPYMVPSFPSSTFPNHWTLVTGLYPSEHGIVGNTFFDPKLHKQFINTDRKFGLNPEFWQGGEPLWTTAKRQGVKSAVHMWPGSEVPTVGDNGPMVVDKYNGSELLSSKVDRVIGWLDVADIEHRPELVLTYVPTIDQFGHKFGISGSNLTDALTYVDDFVALMKQRLNERNLDDIVNLIIVSDHGMAATSNDRLLFLDDVVTMSKVEHIDGWPLFGLRPYASVLVDDVFEEIKTKLAQMDAGVRDNFSLYRVEDIPPEWNFGGKVTAHKFNYRLAPIWIIPNVGYSITTHKKFSENNEDYYPKGVHGYNNTHLLMRAIFLGQGPYFKEKLTGKKVLPFTNVNVYNIVCDTLGIEPSPNNGTMLSSSEFSISNDNSLSDSWRDELTFPDLPYAVEHIVLNATYDLLWRRPADEPSPSETSTLSSSNIFESMIEEESTLLSVTLISLPKPSDFLEDPTTTHTSSTTSKGSIGKLIDDFGDVVEDAEDAIEGAIEDAVDFVEGLFGGEDN